MRYWQFWLVVVLLAATDLTVSVVRWHRRRVDARRRYVVPDPRHRAWRVVGSHSERTVPPRR